MVSLPPARIGDMLSDVDTPALCIDLDIFERNCDTLADRMLPYAGRVSIRPHAKAHKSSDIAKLQLARISSRQPSVACTGVCCQKLCEAEAMVAGGIHDILITNQIVTRSKITRLTDLAVIIKEKFGKDNVLSVV
jgi:D-serine deaminase-like pyridoxal phosphate-dependent protein